MGPYQFLMDTKGHWYFKIEMLKYTFGCLCWSTSSLMNEERQYCCMETWERNHISVIQKLNLKKKNYNKILNRHQAQPCNSHQKEFRKNLLINSRSWKLLRAWKPEKETTFLLWKIKFKKGKGYWNRHQAQPCNRQKKKDSELICWHKLIS